MTTYLLRRLLYALILVVISASLGFFVLHAIPGDPLGMVVEQPGRSADVLEQLRAQYGLNEPVAQQYAHFLSRIVSGDWGTSLVDGQPVQGTLRAALANSLRLGGSAFVLAVLLGLSVGALQGWHPRSRVGRVLGTALTALYAAPEFIIAIALITLLSYKWALFPIGGISNPVVDIAGTPSERLRDQFWHLLLPSIALAIGWGAVIARQQRVSLLEIANDNHVRAARAKGVGEWGVFGRHGFRPSLPAVAVVIGLMMPELVAGTVFVETLFAWPGVGSLLLRSISARDYPMVSVAIVVVGVTVSLGSFFTDAVIAALDPRAWARHA
jgi:peptide/nickel transport system permease protein